MKRIQDPLTKRVFKLKNPAIKFFCPLCRSERAIDCHPRLNKKHYAQIFLISAIIMVFTAPQMKAFSLIFFFATWAIFEMGVRVYFRKQVPCPYCGFDASWYKRDVNLARKHVDEFWSQQNVTLTDPPQNDAPEQEIASF